MTKWSRGIQSSGFISAFLNKGIVRFQDSILYNVCYILKKSENTFNLTNKSEIDIIKPSKERQLNKERNGLKCSRKFEKNFLNRRSVDVLIERMRLT